MFGHLVFWPGRLSALVSKYWWGKESIILIKHCCCVGADPYPGVRNQDYKDSIKSKSSLSCHDMTTRSDYVLLRRVEVQGQKGLWWLRMVEVSDSEVSGAPGEGDNQRYLWVDDEVLVYPSGETANFWGAERRTGGILSCLLLDLQLIFNNNSQEASSFYFIHFPLTLRLF